MTVKTDYEFMHRIKETRPVHAYRHTRAEKSNTDFQCIFV